MNVPHEVAASAESLRNLDLNLLVAFDLLAREVSVTRAASRMGVTQSAMSHTLRRLRALIGDPLLVRVGGAMELTPRAESLVLPIRSGLNALQRALAHSEPFDPAVSDREFRVAGPDLVELLFLPPLLDRLRTRAPGVRLTMLPTPSGDSLSRLQTGELDMAIEARILDGAPADAASGLMRRSLLHDTWSCFARADHPELSGNRRLTLRRFVGLSHAMVSPSGEGPGIVDDVLSKQGLSRRVGLRVAHFYSAPVAMAKSDLVLTAPTSLGGLLGHLDLVQHRAPLELPEHSVDAIWHVRFHEDPGHRWLRDQLAEVGREVAPRRRARRSSR